ncbi:Repressor of RNA polymerase III transcription MAF1-like [Hondaea fermentalgiana]|uniref:Repressor of RNA polymerase III transcription n=1 Tax=Hondaea fermentalgiana TaxID=2315210 RepID=A0A2R5GPU8_9STRA|nr:Repressor of RNA polymerase III transcription MAF1-like [Hondaea fermentalgiana]|eukprot:GBG32329.1 Repressor of RNA polymerase III transcription MAF1-like [Hondaea fermentalgiana]
MKFLDVARLNQVTSFLQSCSVADRKLQGRVEAYSCKAVGEDRRLSKVLEQQYAAELAASSDMDPDGYAAAAAAASGNMADETALGKLSDPHTRRLLTYLICTMNATFPDYDFSALKPDQFRAENLGRVVNLVNSHLSEFVDKQSPRFLEEVWSAVDAEILLRGAEVYTYVPNMEDDPFSLPGTLWSFNFFFYNREEKKVLFFTCCCTLQGRIGAHSDLYGTDDGASDVMSDVGAPDGVSTLAQDEAESRIGARSDVAEADEDEEDEDEDEDFEVDMDAISIANEEDEDDDAL